eukprot:CAMPEP_0198323678 /NCGR_PEP_ID=MMETSP1450-20131203/11851_1 /TAXON_ID=753684 ORGANISM="Madagascaria erythrocladiodes, Strain CCMP3234" /NCGR_SAMPLE_ID=MMETSP1450 /ASSEMBLY_ACC=CAM_ASM_001115 /LENGTH=230 /DNA_ID=CAMNT_0044027407 /DNA_START=90 /DNA_END=782 /DNA_ORIENTATION=+
MGLELQPADRTYLALLVAFALAVVALWLCPYTAALLKPLKLVVIAIHEFSHAAAGLLTGASIEGVQVSADEGGATTMRGGIRCITLPAGYLGSNFWGGMMIFCARNDLAAQIIAGLLAAALLAVLFWADTWLTRGLVLFFLGLVAAFWAIQILTDVASLTYFVLFVGVLTCLYTIFDIYDDLIRRRVNESDASMFARECPCLPAQGWGLLWGLFAVAVTAGSAVLGIVVF